MKKKYPVQAIATTSSPHSTVVIQSIDFIVYKYILPQEIQLGSDNEKSIDKFHTLYNGSYFQ